MFTQRFHSVVAMYPANIHTATKDTTYISQPYFIHVTFVISIGVFDKYFVEILVIQTTNTTPNLQILFMNVILGTIVASFNKLQEKVGKQFDFFTV